jgi:hypothetical protein
VERLQLADTDRLQTALALYMVIAWRINRLMRLGRTLPDLPADLVFPRRHGAGGRLHWPTAPASCRRRRE